MVELPPGAEAEGEGTAPRAAAPLAVILLVSVLVVATWLALS